jgi:hypothetical protein
LLRRGIGLECTGRALGVELHRVLYAGEFSAAESERKMLCDRAGDCLGQIAVIDEKVLGIVPEFQRRGAEVRENTGAPFFAVYSGDVVK